VELFFPLLSDNQTDSVQSRFCLGGQDTQERERNSEKARASKDRANLRRELTNLFHHRASFRLPSLLFIIHNIYNKQWPSPQIGITLTATREIVLAKTLALTMMNLKAPPVVLTPPSLWLLLPEARQAIVVNVKARTKMVLTYTLIRNQACLSTISTLPWIAKWLLLRLDASVPGSS
jgi:hypothetical protein